MKYLTKPILMQAAKDAFRIGYARQVGTDLIGHLPDGARFPILAWKHHDRLQGQRGFPHIRTVIMVTEGETWQIDLTTETFNALPEIDDEAGDVVMSGSAHGKGN